MRQNLYHSHPLAGIAPQYRNRLFRSLCFVALFLMVALIGTAMAIPTSGPCQLFSGPCELFIDLPSAGNETDASRILARWQERGKVWAAFNLGLDYLFLLTYSTLLALACIWSGETMRKCSWKLGNVGILVAWIAWLTALCDAIENAALITMVAGNIGEISEPIRPLIPLIAQVCKRMVFALIAVSLFYTFAGVIAYLQRQSKTNMT